MLTFAEVLSLKTDVLANSNVKYVRHKDTRDEYKEVTKDRRSLIAYQAQQHKEVFHKCDYIASFIGIEQSKAIFIGLFKVNGFKEDDTGFQYDLTEVIEEGIESLKDRVVIDWGSSAQSWHQWIDKNPKPVLEILAKGSLGHFPGLMDVVLTFSELKKMFAHPDGNRDWRLPLSSVKGIYLILDTSTGKQYVGAAYGDKGIWQRWSDYALNGHGGNEQLLALVENDPEYSEKFQFTILQSLSISMSDKEVRAKEQLHKRKLGTYQHGLNSN